MLRAWVIGPTIDLSIHSMPIEEFIGALQAAMSEGYTHVRLTDERDYDGYTYYLECIRAESDEEHATRLAIRQADKERADRADYERLKAKFEGG